MLRKARWLKKSITGQKKALLNSTRRASCFTSVDSLDFPQLQVVNLKEAKRVLKLKLPFVL